MTETLPYNWNQTILGKIIELLSGQDLNINEYNSLKEGVPYITGASNFDGNQILINRWTKNPSVIAQNGDVLLTCKGTVGKIAILNFEKAHIARQVMALRAKNGVLNSFVYYFLLSEIKYLKQSEHGLIPGISRKLILNMKIKLPPLEEQQRIVERIESLFVKLDKANEKLNLIVGFNDLKNTTIGKIDLMKKAILSRAFRGELGTN